VYELYHAHFTNVIADGAEYFGGLQDHIGEGVVTKDDYE
jgi:hypothetical protein